MRLFVALSLPDSVRWQLRLLTGGLPGIRWAPPENYHITLRFIGDIDGRDMDYVDAALAGLRAPAFSLRLAEIGYFGSGEYPRAIWAGVEKTPALFHLQSKVESAIVRAGLTPLGQTYRPHVTLAYLNAAARVKIPAAKLQPYLAARNLFRSEPFAVSHFTLFSSWMGGEHSVYRAERSYALAPMPATAPLSA